MSENLKGTTFENISFEEFYREAATFFQNTQNRKECSPEQAENGNKALGLLYLGGSGWTDFENHRGILLLKLATKREMEVALFHQL
ncbi:MAG: hypothetical protein KAS32_23350 [Candidatus Peribacteraceae bacterium]|nr:hypothetical protein [Candidatus Peribacteraceae bacterium]